MYRVQGEMKIGGQISTLLMIKSLVCKSSLLVVQSQFCKKDPTFNFRPATNFQKDVALKVNKLETMFLCIYIYKIEPILVSFKLLFENPEVYIG